MAYSGVYNCKKPLDFSPPSLYHKKELNIHARGANLLRMKPFSASPHRRSAKKLSELSWQTVQNTVSDPYYLTRIMPA